MQVRVLAPATLATRRLVLRRPRMSDAPAVFEYGSDPEVGRYMDWPLLTCLEEAAAATERALQEWESGLGFSWRITIKPGDLAVGSVSCSVEGDSAEMGFVLARPCWGQGYGTEAARAALDWLRAIETVRRVWASCDTGNLASARVLEKIGMSREKTLGESVVRPNLPGRPRRDCVVYSWTREG